MSKHTLSLLSCLLLATFSLLGTSCSRQAGIDRTLDQADAYRAAGTYDKAEIEYLNTLKKDPDNARAIVALALIFSEQGRMGGTGLLLSKARSLQPDNMEIRAKLAALYLVARKFPEARTEINAILAKQPDHPEAPLLLAESVQQPKDIPEIQAVLKKLSPNPSIPVLAALATLEFRQRKFPEAEALLQQALLLDPESPVTNSALAVLLVNQKNLKAAEAALEKTWKKAPIRSPRKLAYVRFKFQSGDKDQARRLLLEITTQAPDSLPAQLLLAEISSSEKKYDEALTTTGIILTRDSLYYPAIMLTARLHLAKGEAAKALEMLEKIKKLQPNSPEVLHQIALAHLALGDLANAQTQLTKVVELAPDFAEGILLLADLQLRKGDAKAAGNTLKPLLAKRPDLPSAKFMFARTLVSQGALDEALVLFQEVSAATPKDVNALLPIALIYRQQKKTEAARKTLNQVLELSPDAMPAIEQLVDLDLLAGDHKAARQRADALKLRHPDKPGAYLLFAKIDLVEKKLPEAEKELLKVIELQPDAFAAYYLLAGIYGQTEQNRKALDQLELVAKKSPADTPLLMRIALLNERLNNYQVACDTYEKLLVLNPGFVPALNNLAYLLAEKLNNLERSQTMAQKARELAPFDPNIADTLGWILYKQGHYQRAKTLLFESAGKLTNDAVVQSHLGLAHYMMGEIEPARTALQRALQINPELPEKIAIKQRLEILGTDATGSESVRRTLLEKALAENKKDPIVLTQLGAMQLKAGELDQALSTLKTALEINPQNVNAALNLVRVYLARHDTTKALELAQATRKQAPDDPAVGHQLGRLAFQSGDYSWAFSLLQETARKLPDNPEVLWDRAKAAYCVGRVADATETMQQIRQTQPHFADTKELSLYLEMIALAKEPTPERSAAIDQTLKTDPSFVPALMAMGALAEKQANRTAAQQAYQKALAHYPDFTPAKRNLALLAAAADENDAKAYEWAIQAREAFPSDPELAQALGIITYRKGDFNRAADLLKESIARLGEDARRTYFLGLARYRLKDKTARTLLQRSLELGLAGEAATEAKKILAELKQKMRTPTS